MDTNMSSFEPSVELEYMGYSRFHNAGLSFGIYSRVSKTNTSAKIGSRDTCLDTLCNIISCANMIENKLLKQVVRCSCISRQYFI